MVKTESADPARRLVKIARRNRQLEKKCSPFEKGKLGGRGEANVHQNAQSTEANRHCTYCETQNDKRFNETVGEIEKLRNDINLLRQEKTMYQSNLKTLQSDIDSAEQ